MESSEALDVQKKHVSQVLKQLADDYQQTRDERRALALAGSDDDIEFTLLEELELLTVSIRGLGLQFASSTSVNDSRETVAQMKRLKVFDVPIVAQFYFDDSIGFDRLKLYISLLDYLRLLVLEYLEVSMTTESVAA
ncbi:MAG: hypothetical protein AAF716_06165 [Cyanobacteria bacterium P01_D01_bin.1]